MLPNVLVVLVDDVGFGAGSVCGGPCQTPTAERLAAGGLRYNRFYTAALGAPTRQAPANIRAPSANEPERTPEVQMQWGTL
ncbi:sulfatase-like hydrolase/transferase [Nocardioides bizhenqiangii]|uniref:sulfatase-like hydrolase/transferase n=1 Tax=Nocardioides bizhenqiangii TaxID=3095076 RepID=UPI0038620D73